MIEVQDLVIDSKRFRHRMESAAKEADPLVRRLIEDLNQHVYDKAKEFAPKGSTGRLRNEGIIQEHVRQGTVTGVAAFGNQLLVRGSRGFIGAAPIGSEGRSVFTAEVKLNPEVEHAKWVHEGTGIYGSSRRPYTPRVKPYMIFFWHGRKWFAKSVKGQKAQPFLFDAFEYVNNVYAPARLTALRAEISALT